jgi:hypothetical protein
MRASCGDSVAAFSAVARAICACSVDCVVFPDSALLMRSGDCAIAASVQKSPRTRASSAAKLAWSRSEAPIGGLRGSRGKMSGGSRINSGRIIQTLCRARMAANAKSAMRNCFRLERAVEEVKADFHCVRAVQINALPSFGYFRCSRALLRR